MTYRLATAEDLDRLVAMSDQAKESFKAKNIDQWQKGEPNRQVMELPSSGPSFMCLRTRDRSLG